MYIDLCQVTKYLIQLQDFVRSDVIVIYLS